MESFWSLSTMKLNIADSVDISCQKFYTNWKIFPFTTYLKVLNLKTEFNLFSGKFIKDRIVNEVTTLGVISKINPSFQCRLV